jgi:hypothetical protein
MKLTGTVVKVTQRTESIEERGKLPVTKQFEDVSVDVNGGECFDGSAACTPIGFTVSAPGFLGTFREGQRVSFDLVAG